MDNNIKIDSGEKRLTINDDPNRVVVFNPSDIIFAQKFYRLMSNFKKEMAGYRDRMVEIEANEEVDSDGLPLNAEERFDILKETCDYVRTQIDILFGEGASKTIFGDVVNLDMFSQFFIGITPYIESVRKEKVKKYVTKNRPAKK